MATSGNIVASFLRQIPREHRSGEMGTILRVRTELAQTATTMVTTLDAFIEATRCGLLDHAETARMVLAGEGIHDV